MNRFLGHTEDEADYFIAMVQKDRAGSHSLKKRLERQIQSLKSKRLELSERVRDRSRVSEQDKEQFYATYLNAAVHVLTSIPGLQTRTALSAALGVPLSKISETLDFLTRIGVLKEAKGKYSPGPQHIHLNAKSKHIVRHHLNWRLKTMEKIGEAAHRDLHYSVVFSLSEKDAVRIKEMLLQNLEEISKVVTVSKEETAFVYCFDFFELAAAREGRLHSLS